MKDNMTKNLSAPAVRPVLTEKRKADRVSMSGEVAKLAKELGCEVTQVTGDAETYPGPHTELVKIKAPGGLRLHVDFDGHSAQMDVHVLSWHMDFNVSAKLSPSAFEYNMVNTVHHHKATDVAYGFSELMEVLAKRLKACADGSAYQAPGATGSPTSCVEGIRDLSRPNLAP